MGWAWLLRLTSTVGTRLNGRKQSAQLGPCGLSMKLPATENLAIELV